MSTAALPRWRRHVHTRFACIALVLLPALLAHIWLLDMTLLPRLAVLLPCAAATALGLWFWLRLPAVMPPDAADDAALFNAHKARSHGLAASLTDALTQAALLAALWPSALLSWPAAVALMLALLIQRLLGGWALNPFPPALLALALGVMLARQVPHADIGPPLVSLFDAASVAAIWLAAGLLLCLLRLWPARAPLAFLLPAGVACLQGGIAASSFVVAAILAAFVLADTRHLPATDKGQIITGALAGLGTAALWLAGAAPVLAAFPVLLVFALVPWIEHLTLPRR